MTRESPRQVLNLTIDRLVLRGVTADQRRAVTAAFHAELSRLLTGPTASFGDSYSTNLLRLRPQCVASGSMGEIGASGARALVRGLRR